MVAGGGVGGPGPPGGPGRPPAPAPAPSTAGRSAGLSAGVAALTRSPAARRLVGTRLLGQLADGVLQGALASLVLLDPERATTARAIAVGFVVLLAPFTVVGPWVAGLADRHRRRQVLLVAGLVRGGLAVLCALAVAAGPRWSVAVAALAYLSVNRLLLATLSASLPRVVAPADLVAANALVPTLGTGASLLGGAVAVGVRAVPGVGSGSGTDAVLLLVAAVLAGAAGLSSLRLGADRLGPDRLRRAGPERDDRGGRRPGPAALRATAGELAAAVAHLRRRPAAAGALALVSLHRLGYGVLLVDALLLVRGRLGLGVGAASALVGELLTASAVGFALAASATPALVRRLGRRGWAGACAVLAAGPPLAVLAAPRPGVLVVATLVLGLASQGLKITVDTVVQTGVDDDVRGRVFVLYDALFNASLISAAVVAALVLPDDGWSPPVLAALAAGWVALALAVALSRPRTSTR